MASTTFSTAELRSDGTSATPAKPLRSPVDEPLT
jgi:hypothetical protein